MFALLSNPRIRRVGLSTLLVVFPCFHRVDADEWTTWRGTQGNNHAAAGVDVPVKWNLKTGQNVLWKSEIPGRGHSTPIIIDEGIFLTTSETKGAT